MRTTFKSFTATLAVCAVLFLGVLGTRARAEIVPANFWKLVSGNLVPQSSTYKIGSTTVSGAFNNLTVAGTCTGCGGGGSATGTISIASGGTLTIAGSPISLGGGGTADINLANANIWTALQRFNLASTSQLTATSSAYLATLGGNVGIGTAVPLGAFEVRSNATGGTTQGDFYVDATNKVVHVGRQSSTGGDNTGSFDYRNRTGGYYINANITNGTTQLGAGGNPQLSVNLTNVGVGTTTSYAKFGIHAYATDLYTTLFAIASSTATATSTLFAVDNKGTVFTGTGSSASSTNVVTGKWQADTFNTAGSQVCLFIVGTTPTASTGACNR